MIGNKFFSIEVPRTVSLLRWVWLAYVRSALIPLLFVELALLGVYMFSHAWSRTENIVAIQNLASMELSRLAENHADAIEHQLESVAQLTEFLRQETQDALKKPVAKDLESPNRYAINNDGVLYTHVNDGGAAVFFSGFIKIDKEKKQKIKQTAAIDATLRRIVDINPLIVQAYFNSYDSLNRIWPYFDVMSQYAPKMDIPSYNFYYEADTSHNPERKTRWIDAYLDPAGQGWMVSSISPVYKGDFLEGVVGLDITLDIIIKQVLALPIPWQGFAVLINKDGMLLAVPEQAEKLFGLHELTTHRYDQAIRQQTFKPDDFNIYHRPDMNQLRLALSDNSQNSARVEFSEPYLVNSKTLLSTGWRLVIFTPEAEIFKPITTLAIRLTNIGWCLLAGLSLFYVLFFSYLYQRAKRLSSEISEPLRGIQAMAIEIGAGNFMPEIPVYRVKEFQSTIEQMLLTGQQLQSTEQQLIDAKEQAEQANYAKGAFLANMSHEIRTPLNAINGMAELAQDSNIDDKQKHYLDQIQLASQSLLIIINDILDFSKIEAGKIELEDKSFDLEVMLQSVVDLFIHMIDYKQLELFVEIDRELPQFVYGDVQRIRQVLINLVGNALKFTEQGEIRIKVLLVEQQQNICLVRFFVCDTGIGISPETAEGLFQAFTQADVSIARKFGGTGLGLAICQQLVGLMGGKISVNSLLNRGSDFEFTIPLRTDDSSRRAIFNGIQSEQKVLVVDDNQSSCGILQYYLGEWQCEVDAVQSIPQALTQLKLAWQKDLSFAFLILDWGLLQAEGEKLVQLLESVESKKLPEIILLIDSHYQESKQQLLGLNIKPKVILNKPVMRSQLKNAINPLFQVQPHSERNLSGPKILLADLARPIKNRTVLLVEDVKINQQIAKEFLQKAGLQVMLAENGLEAVKWVNKMHFDAVLMDLQMPVMDGIEATRQIRLLPGGKELPIIALTAAAMQHDREACLNAGMNDHLAKPLNSTQLINTLLSWIEHESQASSEITMTINNTTQNHTELPDFDLRDILALLGDDYSQLFHVFCMFKEDFFPIYEEICSKLSKYEFFEAERLLHQLKGVAGSIGATKLHAMSEELDQQLKKGSFEQATFEKWQETFKITMQILEDYLRKNSD